MNSKRYIGLLAVLLSLTIAAQPRLRKPEYWVGFHGGVSASTVAFRPGVAHMTPITDACVLGGNGGFVFRYAEHKFCALQIELNYVHRGWAETSDGGHYSRSLHYIELPLLMNLNFGSKTCRWFLNLGPQIGYCVKDEGNSGVLVNGEGQTQYNALDHPFYWGLLAGTGVYFRTRKAGIYQFEFRYDFSLGSLFNNGVADHFSMANPMDLSFNLAWLWPIVKKSKQ